VRPLDQQTILITGATDGLGRALATDLAGAGTELLLHGRDGERGRATLEEIRATTGCTGFEQTSHRSRRCARSRTR
jgi:short-subunit dehydrogenase